VAFPAGEEEESLIEIVIEADIQAAAGEGEDILDVVDVVEVLHIEEGILVAVVPLQAAWQTTTAVLLAPWSTSFCR
jgi:hypothetical protein